MQARGLDLRWHTLPKELFFVGFSDTGLPGEASIGLVSTTHIHTYTNTQYTLLTINMTKQKR